MEDRNAISFLYGDEIINENDNKLINDKEKSFNRLCELQKLIKRESSLKELCKKYYNTNIINI